MTALALHPEAITAKHATLKAWRDSQNHRPEALTDWTVTRTPDGLLHVSARLAGPDPAAALTAFAARQASFLTIRANPCGEDLLPVLDLSVSGRTAAVWRLDGVWWRSGTTTPPPCRTRPHGRLPRACWADWGRGFRTHDAPRRTADE